MCPHGGFHHFGADIPKGDSEFFARISRGDEDWLFGYTKDEQLNGNAPGVSKPLMVRYSRSTEDY